MAKSPDAFRTISEVADWLGVQAHVLRFWESKFAQVKPIKRAGGRRYYRPQDMLLLGGIKKLLHDDGLTIKGAQKTLREQGVAHVADLSQPLDDLTMAVIEGGLSTAPDAAEEPPEAAEKAQEKVPEDAPEGEVVSLSGEIIDTPSDFKPAAPEDDDDSDADEEDEALAAEYASAGRDHPADEDDTDTDAGEDSDASDSDAFDAAEDAVTDEDDTVEDKEPDREPESEDAASEELAAAETRTETHDAMPEFVRRPLKEVSEADESPEAQKVPDTAEPAAPAKPEPFSVAPPPEPEPLAPKPRIIEVPPLPDFADIPAAPSVLSALSNARDIDAERARAIQPLLARLVRHRASLSSPRKDAGKD